MIYSQDFDKKSQTKNQSNKYAGGFNQSNMKMNQQMDFQNNPGFNYYNQNQPQFASQVPPNMGFSNQFNFGGAQTNNYSYFPDNFQLNAGMINSSFCTLPQYQCQMAGQPMQPPMTGFTPPYMQSTGFTPPQYYGSQEPFGYTGFESQLYPSFGDPFQTSPNPSSWRNPSGSQYPSSYFYPQQQMYEKQDQGFNTFGGAGFGEFRPQFANNDKPRKQMDASMFPMQNQMQANPQFYCQQQCEVLGDPHPSTFRNNNPPAKAKERRNVEEEMRVGSWDPKFLQK